MLIVHASGTLDGMAEKMAITLTDIDVTATAGLLDDEAPRTCTAIRENLPVESAVYHGKVAGREIYTLIEPFDIPEKENATITPVPGDLISGFVPPDRLDVPTANDHMDVPLSKQPDAADGLVDIAIFYGRDGLLLGPDGFQPGNVFARVEENLDGFADACAHLFREGFAGETIRIELVD